MKKLAEHLNCVIGATERGDVYLIKAPPSVRAHMDGDCLSDRIYPKPVVANGVHECTLEEWGGREEYELRIVGLSPVAATAPASRVIGTIQTERTEDGYIGLRQKWKADELSVGERELLGQELAELGEQMRVGNFEIRGEYHWVRPLPSIEAGAAP